MGGQRFRLAQCTVHTRFIPTANGTGRASSERDIASKGWGVVSRTLSRSGGRKEGTNLGPKNLRLHDPVLGVMFRVF